MPTTTTEASPEDDHSKEEKHEDEEEEDMSSIEDVLKYVNKQLKKIKRKMKKLEHQIKSEDSHKMLKHNSKQCSDDTGHTRLNGEVWHIDPCTQCHCLVNIITKTLN